MAQTASGPSLAPVTQSFDADQAGRFGDQLMALFVAAGSPTLAAVAAGAAKVAPSRPPVSVQRISDWRRSRHLPANFEALEPALTWLTLQAQMRSGATELPSLPQWRQWWQHTRTASPVPTQLIPAVELPDEPYAGLAPLTSEDRAVFFGRDEVLAELASLVDVAAADSDAPALVVVTGVSGAGKSSLLGAGLAALADDPSRHWNVYSMSAAELSEVYQPNDQQLNVVAVDQLEAVLVGADDADANNLVDSLVALATVPRTVVVLGIRADMYERCASLAPIARAWQRRSLIVPPMTDAQLEEVISKPARAAGLRVEKGLAATMIADLHASSTPSAPGESVTTRAGQLPLLAQVLSVMWTRRRGGVLTIAGYRAAGGVESAIADVAERAWADLSPRAQDVAGRLLLAMVHIDENAVVRVRTDGGMLASVTSDAALVTEVVETFAQARLITIGQGHVELIHDAVLTAWPRMVEVIDRVRSSAPLLQRVTSDAREWDDAGRDAALLYPPERYHRATELADDPMFGDLAEQFLTATGEHLESRQRRRRFALAAIVVLAVVSVVAAALAIMSNVALSTQRDDAQYAALLETIGRLSYTDPGLSAQLAVAAFHMRPNDKQAQLRVLQTQQLPLPATAPKRHTAAIYDLATKRSGSTTMVATASNDRTVRLWNSSDPREISSYPTALTGYQSFVTSVAFAPDTSMLATASGDGSVPVWDVADPAAPVRRGTLHAPEGAGATYIIRYSPDGRLLATTSDSGAVTLWDTRNAGAGDAPYRPLGVVNDHKRPVRSVAFSPTAPLLAVASDDATMSLIDISNPNAPLTITTIADGGEAGWHSVAISANGRYLAAGRDDGAIAVYDLADPRRPTLVGLRSEAHLAAVWSVGFSADGATMISASLDGTARRWDIDGAGSRTSPARLDTIGEPVRTGSGAIHTASYLSADVVLTAGAAGLLQAWSVPSSPIPAHSLPITRPAVSPDRKLLATGSADQSIDLWDTTDAHRPVRRATIARRVGTSGGYYVAFNRTGRILAVAFGGGRHIQLFDVADPARPRPLADLSVATRYTAPLVFSPARDVLVTGDTDVSLARWDVSDPARPVRLGGSLTGPTGFIQRAVYSPDGGQLSAASADGRVYQWSTSAADEVKASAPLDVHSRVVNDIAYAKSGGYLYTASDDETISVHNRQGRQVFVARVGNRVAALSVSDDGRTLAVGTDQGLELWDLHDPARLTRRGDDDPLSLTSMMTRYATFVGDQTIYTGGQSMLQWWNTDVLSSAKRVCDTTKGNVSPSQWQAAAPDIRYTRPCVAV
ncbi:putative WD-40 repeat protein [Gordonia effusa NBRC 100432]|uniref:Putative WD-40 repeat protein n=1 Tax=Gordonia effusa NBRC 100432 TaxID=1077974 RepID=H0QY59_9ACTN|nr:putative WD-40 repeat protein [Gordonia effusa NBRC 100432]